MQRDALGLRIAPAPREIVARMPPSGSRHPPPGTARVRRVAPALLLLLAGCAAARPPAPATEQAREIGQLWDVFLVAGVVVWIVVSALILWPVIRYRRRGDDLPPQVRENIPLEVAYTAIPVAIVVALFVLTFRVERSVERPADAPAATVRILAFNWSWRFEYVGEGVAFTGTPARPPELVVPVGEPVRIELQAHDVVHSFYVPAFLFKRDATPGLTTTFDLRVEEEGVFAGKCAEFCGLDHARMTFTVRAVSPEEFRAWLEANGGTG